MTRIPSNDPGPALTPRSATPTAPPASIAPDIDVDGARRPVVDTPVTQSPKLEAPAKVSPPAIFRDALLFSYRQSVNANGPDMVDLGPNIPGAYITHVSGAVHNGNVTYHGGWGLWLHQGVPSNEPQLFAGVRILPTFSSHSTLPGYANLPQLTYATLFSGFRRLPDLGGHLILATRQPVGFTVVHSLDIVIQIP